MKKCYFLFYIVLLIFFLSPVRTGASGGIVTDGLIGYWHYKQGVVGDTWENIAPSTIGNHNGLLVNGAVLQSDGIFLDGANDHIDLSFWGNTYGNPIYNSSLTFEITFKPLSINSTDYTNILKAGNYEDYLLLRYNPLDEIGFAKEPSPQSDYEGQIAVNVATSYTLTFDRATGRWSSFQDGSPVSTPIVDNQPLRYETNNISIGSTLGGVFPHAKVISFKVYNRALSSAEVLQNFQVGFDNTGVVLSAPPSPPMNLSIAMKTSSSLQLNWDAVPSATNYIIKRDGVQVGSGSGTSFTDSGLSPATAYQYEIIAQNVDGNSPPASLNITTKADDWVQISVGSNHVLGLKSDGSVWSWGRDDLGSLGSGVTGEIRYIPKRVMQNSTTPFGGAVQVEAGEYVSYAVKSDGSVWSWGEWDSLGTGSGSTPVPSRVRGVGGSGYLSGIVKISSNQNRSVYALKSDGTLYAWGYNNGGTIGDGTTSGTKTYPVQVKNPSGTGFLTNVADVLSYGDYFTSTIAKLSDGSFLSWGNNNDQMLGYSNGNATEILPKPFPQLSAGNKLSGTYRHALVLKSDGTVVGFGNSQNRQLSPSVSYSSNACCIATYSLPSKDIAAGSDHTFVLKNDGKIIGIGSGSLGNGTYYAYPGSLNFVDVSTIDDAESIYSGNKGTYVIRGDGTLWGWGGFNSLGDGTRNSRLTPVKIGDVTAPTFASSSFTSSNLTSASVRLNWTDNQDATSFIIKRNGIVVYEGLPSCWSGCYINNSGLSGGTTYTYELIAKNEAGESPPMILVVNPPVTRSWNLASPNPILNFGTVTVDDTVQVLTANLGIMPVSHQGANPDGWRVTVSAAPFSQANGGSLSLPVNTLKLNAIQNIAQTTGSSLLPIAAAGSHIIDNGAVEIINAPAGSGEGDFNTVFPPDALELSIDTSRVIVDPLNNPTTYRSTITWSMSVGP